MRTNRNIVVLSDGTGNGAAKAQKTNVWRLYRALDLHDERQVAFYDDGVGSGNSRTSKILGGAFGLGLKRNVLDMYKFLCRNYQAADDDDIPDRIYLFGFSRGAFTVRLLASFIQTVGLFNTKDLDETEINRFAEANYSHYRRKYEGGLIYRGIANSLYRNLSCNINAPPKIEFVGVWDTVDAYALPMDELAMIWHRVAYPIRFTKFDLSDNVVKARHAISIDDERHTFHPVLWNEPVKNGADLQQVWFTGVHANVGGGYPDDSLALVSLDWMMSECESETPDDGLVFINHLRQQYHDQSDWNGPANNSRAGLGVYYRYKPREIEHLCNPPDLDLHVAEARIHRSVFERIANPAYPYAPTGLPRFYTLVGEGRQAEYEEPNNREPRLRRMDAAKNVIMLRRILYVLFLVASVVLLASRYFLDWDPARECSGSTCSVAPLLNWLPEIFTPWTTALLQNGVWLFGFLVAFSLLLYLMRFLRKKTFTLASHAWCSLNGIGGNFYGSQFLTRWRNTWERSIGFRMRQALAIIISVAMVFLILWALDSSIFHIRSTVGNICESSSTATSSLAGGEIHKAKLLASDGCKATKLKLEKGVVYRFNATTKKIVDGTQCTTNVDGLVETTLLQKIFSPFKRHRDQPYMKLMGRIGDTGNETFPIDARGTDYTPLSDGRLYLYVNDAVSGVNPNWDFFYKSKPGANEGEVRIDVLRSPAVPLPTPNEIVKTMKCVK